MHEKSRGHKKTGAVLLAALALLLSLGPALPGARPAEARQAGGPEAPYANAPPYASALPAVGFIYLRDSRDSEDRTPKPKACAAVVRGDGVIVTGYRAICRDNSEALYDEMFFELPESGSRSGPARRYRLRPALIDRNYDLALLRVAFEPAAIEPAEPPGLTPLALADSLRAQLLDELTVIGFEEKGVPSLSVSRGVVEGIDRVENWIKTDARLLRGGSGIAVTAEGKLLGIPAKVVVDSQSIDSDGDGRPDAVRQFGAVAFLRPAHLVASMLDRLGELEARRVQRPAPESLVASPMPPPARASESSGLVSVKGIVRSGVDGKPVAGARVGLVAAGSVSVNSASLLAWGGTNPEGRFEMNRRVSPGLYTVRAVALGYEPFTLSLDVDEKTPPLVIELRRSK